MEAYQAARDGRLRLLAGGRSSAFAALDALSDLLLRIGQTEQARATAQSILGEERFDFAFGLKGVEVDDLIEQRATA